MSRSTDLVMRLVDGTTQPGRGEHMQLVLQYEWLDHSKVGELEPKEAMLKECVWQWFSSLDREALERVRTGAPPLHGVACEAARGLALMLAFVCALRRGADAALGAVTHPPPPSLALFPVAINPLSADCHCNRSCMGRRLIEARSWHEEAQSRGRLHPSAGRR